MGALIAGSVAQDREDAAIYEAMHRNFVAQNPSGDYTLPVHSLLRGRRTQRLLVEGFGTTAIEQLPRRFFCVSTDLNTRSISSREPWLERATEWCWAKLEGPDELSAYWVKFALDFLDRVPDKQRAHPAIERLGLAVGQDGSISVPAAPRMNG